ncbi:probable tRNA modification GTPase GTPBP3, mitochondrial [Coccomyxa sp. Obi]|nr:probable tRNA modification GTPase GTPBP3, mitochondrial [Coccomyxa sp. Obi]
MIWSNSRLCTRIYQQLLTAPNLAVGTRILRASHPCCTRLAAPLYKSLLTIRSAPVLDLLVLPHAARLFQTQRCSTAVYQDQGGQENDTRDTIAALSSGAGRSGVAVIRLSGPKADLALQRLLKTGRALPEHRVATLASLRDPRSGDELDRGLVMRFPGPASFTGEDVVELHVHGGPATVRAVLDALRRLPGVRPAEAGEFALRAFQAGKLDLTAVEGLADLLAAETDAQRRQALRQSGGEMRRRHERWRGALLRCLAAAEAIIDFGEDEGIAPDVAADVRARVAAVRAELARHVTGGRRGELIRSGIKVAIVGPPNAGKSSLLNVLAARDAAIVSPTPGTTRDAVEVAVELEGYKVTLVDTAGLRESADAIEVAGMQRARSAMADADIIALVTDSPATFPEAAGFATSSARTIREPHTTGTRQQTSHGSSYQSSASTGDAIQSLNRLLAMTSGTTECCDVSEPAATAHLGTVHGKEGTTQPEHSSIDAGLDYRQQPAKLLLICNKRDLWSPSENTAGPQGKARHPHSDASSLDGHVRSTAGQVGAAGGHMSAGAAEGTPPTCSVSCKTGEGIEELLSVLGSLIRQVAGTGEADNDNTLITRVRHRQLLEECVAALERYEGTWQELEIAAEELRTACRALGKITGAVDTEDVLDALFSEFCIGK